MKHPIQEYSEKARVSYTKIAHLAGVTRAMISQIIHRKVYPSPDVAARLAAACDGAFAPRDIVNPRLRPYFK